MKIVFIGSGNLATQLSKTLNNIGFDICQIYSKSIENAKILAEQINCEYTNDISKIKTDADIYLFSVKDSALDELISSMPKTNGIWLHTAGSIPMNIFKNRVEKYGVFYPLQTFSKTKNVDFQQIPIFLEASDNDVFKKKIGRAHV